eukprot:COSAG01_NODE_4442_length_5020_cov_4.707377_4_plen_170_part_00
MWAGGASPAKRAAADESGAAAVVLKPPRSSRRRRPPFPLAVAVTDAAGTGAEEQGQAQASRRSAEVEGAEHVGGLIDAVAEIDALRADLGMPPSPARAQRMQTAAAAAAAAATDEGSDAVWQAPGYHRYLGDTSGDVGGSTQGDPSTHSVDGGSSSASGGSGLPSPFRV